MKINQTLFFSITKHDFLYFQKEIEPRCAEALCRLFPSDSCIDIMSIALKAKRNKKRYSSRSQSRSPVPVNILLPTSTSPLPMESPSPSPPTTLIINRQLSKERSRRSSSASKYRPTSSSRVSSRHSPARYHHHYHHHRRRRSPSANDRHRSDVALYLFHIRLMNMAILFFTNRTFKKGVG